MDTLCMYEFSLVCGAGPEGVGDEQRTMAACSCL